MKLFEIVSNSGSLGRGKPMRPVNAARETLRHGLPAHGVVIPIRSASASSARQRDAA